MPEHDWVRYPELANSQMQTLYFDSPHKQITEDIRVEVVKVHDGDTITVRWHERDFDFPVRFLGTNAPELDELNGKEVQSWLEDQLLNQEVDILIDKDQRVGKWGRLLGRIFYRGLDIGDQMKRLGLVTSFENRNEGKIPEVSQWL